MQLLLEVGVEELPQSEVYNLENQLRENTEGLFRRYRLRYERVKPIVAPRRLGVLVFGVAERQDDVEEKKRGPAKKVAFNEDGTPSRALLGFINSIGASLEDVVVENTEKGEYVFVTRKIRGKEAKEVVSDLLRELVNSLGFAKPMRWGSGKGPFVRPVHWVVALLDEESIPLEIFGVSSDRYTCSHRYLKKTVEIRSAGEYPDVMKDCMVIPFIEERRKHVRRELERVETERGLKIVEDEELIDEVVALTEYPTAFLGEFKEMFLRLPAEVVETALKHHQRVFAVEKEGKLVNSFVAFIDGPRALEDSVRNGYRRVIEARLEDAAFYMGKDRQKKLEDFLSNLDGIVFQRELGTMRDKVRRIVKLVTYLSHSLGITGEVLERALRAAQLSKADIATMLVYEFPELQGTVARIYASLDGEPYPVCVALEEQYMDLPESVEGALLCLADKLDTIVGNFLIDNIPSGSRDPYGLRRKAFSIMRTLIKFEWDLDLGQVVEHCVQLLGIGVLDERFEEFMKSRLQSILDEEKLDYDVVRAVLHLWRTPLRAFLSGKALQRVKDTEAYQKLAVGFERVHNISRNHESAEFDTRLFKEDAEYELFKLYSEVKPRVEDHLKHLDYGSALNELIRMKDTIDRYFDNVFVMDGDLAIRMNRLGFLKSLSNLFLKVADLRHLVVEKG